VTTVHRGGEGSPSQVESGRERGGVVVRIGRIGLNVVQGARIAGADKIIGVDLNPQREALARRLGSHAFPVDPKRVSGDLVAHLVELTGGGADYSFECVARRIDAPGARMLSPRLGGERDHRCGRFRAGNRDDAAVSTGDRRVWKGTAFGGARGRTGCAPRSSIGHKSVGKDVDIDRLITHKLPLERITSFDLMHEGEIDVAP